MLNGSSLIAPTTNDECFVEKSGTPKLIGSVFR